MNMISQLRAQINIHGKAELLIDDYNQLQAEWIKRTGADDPRSVIEACFAIQVEKLLLAKLGRNWTPAGISIESLVDELAARGAAGAPINQPEAGLREALVVAEAALADIGDGEGPVYDRVSKTNRSWLLYQAEKRALQALPAVRAALAATPPAV